jgi:hypothetical protein
MPMMCGFRRLAGWRCTGGSTWLGGESTTNGGKHVAEGAREFRPIPHAADVHEHHLGCVSQEVVVKRCNLQAIVKGYAHHRIDLIFQHDHIAHDHDLLPSLLKGCP